MYFECSKEPPQSDSSFEHKFLLRNKKTDFYLYSFFRLLMMTNSQISMYKKLSPNSKNRKNAMKPTAGLKLYLHKWYSSII